MHEQIESQRGSQRCARRIRIIRQRIDLSIESIEVTGSWLLFGQGARRLGLTHHAPSPVELYLDGIVAGFWLAVVTVFNMSRKSLEPGFSTTKAFSILSGECRLTTGSVTRSSPDQLAHSPGSDHPVHNTHTIYIAH